MNDLKTNNIINNIKENRDQHIENKLTNNLNNIKEFIPNNHSPLKNTAMEFIPQKEFVPQKEFIPNEFVPNNTGFIPNNNNYENNGLYYNNNYNN